MYHATIDELFPTQWRGLSGAGKMAQFMGRQMLDDLRFRRGLGNAPKTAAAPNRKLSHFDTPVRRSGNRPTDSGQPPAANDGQQHGFDGDAAGDP